MRPPHPQPVRQQHQERATITAETSVASYTREQRAVQWAAELIAFADGIEAPAAG